ncbi:MAG TPA: hypothetical protein VH558_00450 [Pseudolabrys sp.]|jgi:hypothetical protein
MPNKRTTSDPAESARRKRPASTIDLTATDVSAAAPQDEASSQRESAPPEAPTSQPEAAESDRAADAGESAGDRRTIRQVAFAGLGGAAAAAIVMFGIWLAGLIPARFDKSPAPDPAIIASLNARLAQVEATAAKPPPSDPAFADRLLAADNAVKSLGIAVAALNKRSDEIAARVDTAEKTVTEMRDTMQGLARNTAPGITAADVETLRKRIAVLEQAVKGSTEDKAARLALTAAALRDAVVRGARFTAELQEARALGAEEKYLAPLVPFAANGLPAAAAVAQDLRALMPEMIKASGTQGATGSFLDRLQANAGKLVRIHPVEAPVGTDSAAVLARVEAAIARADIDAALADLEKLDPATRAPAREWIAKVQARQAALAAARQFAADATHMLGKR